MAWRSCASAVLAVCCFALIGCPAPQDEAPAGPDGGDEAAEKASGDAIDEASSSGADAPPATPWKPSEPSIQYVGLDAPEGVSQAVVVRGQPLVFTGQVLPLGADGSLVGEDSPEEQILQVLGNLERVLEAAASGLNRLVRLHVCVDGPETAERFRQRLAERVPAENCPAMTVVVSPLSPAEAVVAVDAVATTSQTVEQVDLQRVSGGADRSETADVAVMPAGGFAYLSGQPDKSERLEAVGKSLDALFDMLDQLGLAQSHVARMKVFIDSADATAEVAQAIEERFPEGLAPPLVFVVWNASAPIEIELVAHRPLTETASGSVRFYTPPGVKPSPTFSRAALIEADRQIFISGLAAQQSGDGEAEVRDVFAQLEQILAETGSDLRHLAKATYYVSTDDASTMLNKLRPEFYDPERPPAASKVMVEGVGETGRGLRMDMIAVGVGR